MTGISGYNNYAQTLIQQQLVQQRNAGEGSSASAQSKAQGTSRREELFRAILEANNPTTGTRTASSVTIDAKRAAPTEGRGQFVDIVV